VVLTACNPAVRSTCKTPAEITTWLKNKFIYVAHNAQVFNPQEYDSTTFDKLAVM